MDVEGPGCEKKPALPAPGLCWSPRSKVGRWPATSTSKGRRGLPASHWPPAGHKKGLGQEQGVEAKCEGSLGPEEAKCVVSLAGPGAG